MVPAAFACGVPPRGLRTYGKIRSSDVPYEDSLAVLQPDYIFILMPRAASVRTANRLNRDLAARSRRIICRLTRAQLEDSRHAVLYGSQASVVWEQEELTQLLKDTRLHQTHLRWCNMGARSPSTGFGINAVVRVVSTMPLWGTRCAPDKSSK